MDHFNLNLDIQMERKELTKTFVMTSNWKKPFFEDGKTV